MSDGNGGDERTRPDGEPKPQDPARPSETGEQPAVPPEDPAGEPGGPGEPDEPGGRRTGRISYQDESTAPREPTLAEKRARQQAARREREEASARYAAEQAKSKKRKRILIGTGVTVGVVALIAIGYSVVNADDEVEARCVGPDNVVVDDSNCVTPASSTTHSGGGFFPIFIGAGGAQYHYNYGGSGNIGQVASGGTTVVPKDGTTVKSSTSGKTISRGGLGVSGSGSSSGA
jgi:hypothetical protein